MGSSRRPLSQWRAQQVVADCLNRAIKANLSLEQLRRKRSKLRRHLCDTPRRRRRRRLVDLTALRDAIMA
jgi:hypothetical protein